LAQDDFSFDPKSWSKARPKEGDSGADASGKAVPDPIAVPGKNGTPQVAPDAAAEGKAGSGQTQLPEAWSAVVAQVSGKGEAAVPAGGRASRGNIPPDRPASTAPGKAATSPPGKTALPEAWSAVLTGLSPDLPTPLPQAEGAIDESAPAPRSRVPLMLALSAVLLAGGGVFAWSTRQTGAAAPVAPSAPTARQIAASEAPPPPTAVERAINLGSAGELASALAALGVPGDQADAAAKAAASVMKAAPGYLRAHVVLLPEGEGFRLQRLQASHADGSGVVVTREDDGSFRPRAVAADLTREVKVLRGELDSESFYTSAVTAGLTDTLIPEFINAFAFDFNLASEVQPGDTFEVAFEQSVNESGEAVGQPQLLFASLTTKVKSVALYRFKLPDGAIGWFDGNGASTKRGFMRTPVDGARISSKFGLRFHPVLHYTRLHAGVDFAVPIGTPVYAAADGTVIGSSPTGCGGNMAVVEHDNGWVTRYFHLSRFAPGLQNGQRVEQGFTVGLSGSTGTCTTGPHLHYEVRIKGDPVDPLSIPTEGGKRATMAVDQLPTFMKERDRVDVARAKQAF
jgi:murein DD-endopeptidase MepM/ murein hydrolase activator NlpD